jgi:hypothetical protein
MREPVVQIAAILATIIVVLLPLTLLALCIWALIRYLSG